MFKHLSIKLVYFCSALGSSSRGNISKQGSPAIRCYSATLHAHSLQRGIRCYRGWLSISTTPNKKNNYMKKKKIALLVGSLRKDSLNLKVAKVLSQLAPESLELELVPIGNLPLYNEDLEADVPQAWATFRSAIQAADGILFVTPEYNRTTTPALKNAIDVASRPWGKNAWNEKPGAVISVSMSALGGFGANHNIRQAAACLNVPIMQQPEAYIGNAHTLFNEQGELISSDTETFLKNFMVAYEKWVNRFSNT